MDPWVPPPEFGADGSAPPASSSTQIEADEVVVVRTKDRSAVRWTRMLDDIELADLAPYSVERHAKKLLLSISPRERGYMELKQVVVSSIWRRQPEIRQLPPASSLKMSFKVKVGATRTTVEEFSSSLGFKLGGSNNGITGMVSEKLQATMALTEESEYTEELSLVNDSRDSYRRFAFWQELKVVDVRPLCVVIEDAGPGLIRPSKLGFHRLGSPLVFTPSCGATVTFKDVPVG